MVGLGGREDCGKVALASDSRGFPGSFGLWRLSCGSDMASSDMAPMVRNSREYAGDMVGVGAQEGCGKVVFASD